MEAKMMSAVYSGGSNGGPVTIFETDDRSSVHGIFFTRAPLGEINTYGGAMPGLQILKEICPRVSLKNMTMPTNWKELRGATLNFRAEVELNDIELKALEAAQRVWVERNFGAEYYESVSAAIAAARSVLSQ